MTPTRMGNNERDVFLCHAADDKDAFVRPFASELELRGISYWLDEAEIKWGDTITRQLSEGLSQSRYVVVFLSANFMKKHWPASELGAALHRENTQGTTVVLPLIIGNVETILSQHPLLRDKKFLQWSHPIASMVDRLEALTSGNKKPQHRSDLDLEPMLGDFHWALVRTPLFDDIYRLVARRPDLRTRVGAVAEIPLTTIAPTLAPNLREAAIRYIDEHRRRAESIKAAVRGEPGSDGSLQIVSVSATRDAELDVVLRTLSDDAVCITRIGIRVLRDVGSVFPYLQPSATYEVPVGHLPVGDATGLDVSHVIEPHRADRLLIAARATRMLFLRLTLHYNRHYSASENVWLWDPRD